MASQDDNTNPADELLSAYIDGELTDSERAQVEQRLAGDEQARRTVEELRSLSTTLRSLPTDSPGAEFTSAVVRLAEQQRGQQRSGDENQSAAGQEAASRDADRPSASPAEPSVPLPVGRSQRGWVWAGIAVAASLLLLVFAPEEPATDRQEVARVDSAPKGLRGGGAEIGAPPAEIDSLKPEALESSSLSGETAAPVSEPSFARSSGFADIGGRVLSDRSGMATGEDLLDEDASPMLVVRVELRRDAFRNNYFDQVLTDNGIVVDGSLSESARSRGGQSPGDRYEYGATRAAAGGSSDRNSSEFNANVKSVSDEADVLVVEAPVSQIAACLSTLQNDPKNCTQLYVCPTDQTPSSGADEGEESEDRSSHQANVENAGAWQGYNRLGAPKAAAPTTLKLSKSRAQQAIKPQGDARAYRLKGEQRGRAFDQQQNRPATIQDGPGTASNRGAASQQELPAPTEGLRRVQALLIVEEEGRSQPESLAEESPLPDVAAAESADAEAEEVESSAEEVDAAEAEAEEAGGS